VISLRGKRALVTGGSRGIGAATALLFAECGADVAIGYRSRKEDAAQITNQARGFGVRAFAYAHDIGSREGSESLLRSTVADLGGLDFFVGNAGIWPADDVPVVDMESPTQEQLERCLSAIERAHAQKMGVAVHCAAGLGRTGTVLAAWFVTQGLSAQNAIARVRRLRPGSVDTEMCAGPFADGGRDRIAASIPLGRVAHPRDIAGPIIFLCSELGRHITGEILNVNGGSVLAG